MGIGAKTREIPEELVATSTSFVVFEKYASCQKGAVPELNVPANTGIVPFQRVDPFISNWQEFTLRLRL